MRPKQTDLVSGKGQFRLRFPQSAQLLLSDNDFFRIPAPDTDIISAQHFWTGGLETAGPGCYDAVAIARAAGFRMLVMSRIRHAAIANLMLNHYGDEAAAESVRRADELAEEDDHDGATVWRRITDAVGQPANTTHSGTVH